MKSGGRFMAAAIAFVMLFASASSAASQGPSFDAEAYQGLNFDTLRFDPTHAQQFLDQCDAFAGLIASDSSHFVLLNGLQALNRSWNSLVTEYGVCHVRYYQDPEANEARYLSFLSLFAQAVPAMREVYDRLMESDSFIEVLREAGIDPEAYQAQIDAALGPVATDQQLAYSETDNALVADYQTASRQEYTTEYGDRLWTREEADADEDLTPEAYYEIVQSLSQERNQATAEPLLELIALRRELAASYGYDSVADYYAAAYGQGRSREELEAFYQAVKKYVVPVYQHYALRCSSLDPAGLDRYAGADQAARLDAVAPVIGQIAPQLGELFQFMSEHNLCDIETSDAKLDIGVTVPLPTLGLAFLFDKPDGTYYDITTLIHEFGHFSALCCSPMAGTPIDVSEAQSQGLEVLALPYADTLFPDAGDAYQSLVLLHLLQSVVDGCLYDEFQLQLYDLDDPTVDSVNRLFSTLAQAYGYRIDADAAYDWVAVHHTYDFPFYYINYSTSALYALDLFMEAQDAPAQASERYLSLLTAPPDSLPGMDDAAVSDLAAFLDEHLYLQLCGLDGLGGHWALPEIGQVTAAGWMEGTDSGFQPSAPASRAMLVTILYRVAGQPPAESHTAFEDVSEKAWYAAAVDWGVASGVTTGTGRGFSPDESLTRESLAVLLYRFADTPEATGDLSGFSDGETVSPWAEDAVSWAVGQGILSGYNGRLNPQGKASRAETAALLARYFKPNALYLI